MVTSAADVRVEGVPLSEPWRVTPQLHVSGEPNTARLQVMTKSNTKAVLQTT